jgi:hypothetical protein
VAGVRPPGTTNLGDQKLAEVVALLRDFLMPPTEAAAAGGPWQTPPDARR